MDNFANEYPINFKGGEVLLLKKGMTKQQVISILGNPIKSENCINKSNEKLIFKIKSHQAISVSYTILFTRKELVYVAKIN